MDEQSIFVEALDQPASERAAWLEEVCGADSALRQRIEALLRQHEQANSFLEHPAAELPKTRPPSRETGEVIIVNDVNVADDLRIDGERESNSITVLSSDIGGDVRISNRDGTASGEGAVYGQFVRVDGNTIDGRLTINNRRGTATSTGAARCTTCYNDRS